MDNDAAVFRHSSFWKTCTVLATNWDERDVPCFELAEERWFAFWWKQSLRVKQQHESSIEFVKRMTPFKMWINIYLEGHSWFKIFVVSIRDLR